MRRAAAALTVVFATAGLGASGASGGTGWPFWWWSEAKANRVMLRQSPARIFPIADRKTVLRAQCSGQGRYHRTAAGLRLYHVFRCLVWFRDDVSHQLWTPALQREELAGRDPSRRWCPSVRHDDRLVTYGTGNRGCP